MGYMLERIYPQPEESPDEKPRLDKSQEELGKKIKKGTLPSTLHAAKTALAEDDERGALAEIGAALKERNSRGREEGGEHSDRKAA